MTLAYAFDPYAAARVAREIDLIKAANPGCYTLAGVPYVVVQTPTGIVLQKAGRRKVAPGQMSLFGAPSQPASPKMSNVGRTKTVDGITYKLNQNSRWERTDKGQAAAAKPALAVLRDEPSDRPLIAEMQSASYDRGEVRRGDEMPKFDVVSDRESQPEGTLFYDDPGVTPEQKEFMERGGQNYIPPTIASRAEIDDIFPDVATTAEKARGYGYQGKDDYEVVARYMNGGAARMVGNNNVYPVHFTDKGQAAAAKPALAVLRDESLPATPEPKTIAESVRQTMNQGRDRASQNPNDFKPEVGQQFNISGNDLKRSHGDWQVWSVQGDRVSLGRLKDGELLPSSPKNILTVTADQLAAMMNTGSAVLRDEPARPKITEDERIANTADSMKRYHDRMTAHNEAMKPQVDAVRSLHADQMTRNTPEWTTFEGEDVIQVPGSNYVAVPVNGRKNSAKFDIVSIKPRDYVTQVSKGEVHSWLAHNAIAAENDAPSAGGDDAPSPYHAAMPEAEPVEPAAGEGAIAPSTPMPTQKFEGKYVISKLDSNMLVQAERLTQDEAIAEGYTEIPKVPPSLVDYLNIPIGSIRSWNSKVELARQTDKMFNGGGRYVWEATKGEEPEWLDGVDAKIEEKRQFATAQNVDFDKLLDELGYSEPTRLAPNESDANNKPASDRPMAMPEAEPAAAAEPAGGEGAGANIASLDESKERRSKSQQHRGKAAQMARSILQYFEGGERTRIINEAGGIPRSSSEGVVRTINFDGDETPALVWFSGDKPAATLINPDGEMFNVSVSTTYGNKYKKLNIKPIRFDNDLARKISDRPMAKTLSLGGARYILDGNILRKTSMEWEEFKPEAEAMHKEAQGDEAKGEDDPCWKGYEAVGLKRKGKRMVPNCVPV